MVDFSKVLTKEEKEILSNLPPKKMKKAMDILRRNARYEQTKGKTTPPFYNFVPCYKEAFENRDLKYILFKGGRGSGKSFGDICWLIEESFNPLLKDSLFVFAREVQTSISDSIYANVKSMIEQAQLGDYFDIQKTVMKNKVSGVQFSFMGLRATGGKTAFSQLNKIKGQFNIKYIFVDEAQDLSEDTINVLFPTVNRGSRVAVIKKDWHTPVFDVEESESRFLFAMNPNFEHDPIVVRLQRYIDSALNKGSKVRALILHKNIFDIPVEFQDSQLLEEANEDKGNVEYDHVWKGAPCHLISGYPWAESDEIRLTKEFAEMPCIAFLDPSFKGRDYTALSFIGEKDGQIYAWGCVWKLAWNTAIDEIVEMINIFKPNKFWYEENSLGSVPEDLFAECGIRARPHHTVGNKHNRIYKVAHYMAFRIKFVRNWCNDQYFKQVVEFTEDAKYDDAPDSLASAIIKAKLVSEKMRY
jgi:predicted phage terminase large subunit-like protein